jgi:hypothetical protein
MTPVALERSGARRHMVRVRGRGVRLQQG